MINKMFQSKRFLVLFTLLIISMSGSFASESFERIKRYSTGIVNIEMPVNGYFLYGSHPKDSRVVSPGFLIGGVVRNSFDVFSYEEWNGYLGAKEHADEIENQKKQKSVEQLKTLQLKHLNWPKVVSNDSTICVPSIEFVKSNEWKSHLVCLLNP